MFPENSATGWLAMAPLMVVIALVALRAGADIGLFLSQFIAVTLALDTLTRMLGYVFVSRVRVDGVERASDIALVAQGLGGPQLLWGILVSMIALLLLAGGLRVAWRPAPRPV